MNIYRSSRLQLDRGIGEERGMGARSSFGFALNSLGFTWTHLDSRELTRTHLVSLGLTWTHLESLDSTGLIRNHVASLGLTCWTHLDSLGLRTNSDSLSLNWPQLDSLGFASIHLGSQGPTSTHLDSLGLNWTH